MDKKKLLVFSFFFILFATYYLHQHPITRGKNYPLKISKNATTIPKYNITSESYLGNHSSFKECLFKIKTNYHQHYLDYYVNFTVFRDSKILASYNLTGVKGGYLCLPDGILLYAYYPDDVLGNTSMLFIDYNLSEKWRKEFDGLTLPEYYTDKKILLIKHGSEEWNVKACLYKLNIETGEIISKFCPEPYYGSEILDVKVFKNRIYLTTSRGFLYLLEGNKSKNVFIETIEGIKLGARMRIDANEKYVVVAYFFANEIGKEENGLCVFTSEHLIKISCKKFENTPWDVRIEGNIIYVQFRNGEIKTYKITT